MGILRALLNSKSHEIPSKINEICYKTEQEWIDKMRDQLKENLHVGKPIRFSWFREKKRGNKRLFYLVNENTRKVILVAFGVKKEQQQIIDQILENRDAFLRIINEPS